ncbi:hypothetical protein DCAR_0314239 [Daucus carota subsp. sativus]|uniref:PGG domain-containing protein n=2 Tax=Daucus carota subsp. sativus TaxID=79200 RepID=A0AAF0WRS7_DAUCS|nr:PREDICTED: ankyrin repeat-containing protein At3g12360-like [Daucus carota subsp. sativus]WOG94942.1 hypothetical protein DCAR_0314239 [Daucus carota subsp. sativus]
MEKKLYDACLRGDVDKLEELIREDELILARVSISSCFNQTVLHVASMLGHFKFAESILSYKPDFASRLDSQGRSPLHLASANGYANIVILLLEYDPKMCIVLDEDGRTPLQLAVMNGQHEAVSELIKVKSELHEQEIGEVLQLCVMYNRLNVLVLVLELTSQHLSNRRYDKGKTILQLATSLTRTQIVKYLVTRSEVNVNAVDQNGFTALDIIEQMPKDVKTIEIKELLISAGTSRAKEIKAATKTRKSVKRFTIFQDKREKRDKTMLIVASVIAAMAYQAAISPPGGVAGMDASVYSDPSPSNGIYDLGPANSLLAYFYPDLSNAFWICNTISFMASLSVIFLYVSGATLKQKFFIWLIRAAMWITLSSMTMAYSCAVAATTPEYENNSTLVALVSGLATWLGLIGLAIVVLIYRSVRYIVRTNKRERTAGRMKIRTNIV